MNILNWTFKHIEPLNIAPSCTLLSRVHNLSQINTTQKSICINRTYSINVSTKLRMVFSFSSAMPVWFKNIGNLMINRASCGAPHNIEGSVGAPLGTICQASTFCKISRDRVEMPMPSGSKLRSIFRLADVSDDWAVVLLPEQLLVALVERK